MAFYGDLFRPVAATLAATLAAGDPPFTAAEAEDGFEYGPGRRRR